MQSINHYDVDVSDLNQAVQNSAVNIKYNLQNEKQENLNQATGDHNSTNGIDLAI
ncbi:hypothetical protein H4Q26_003131 [Puccinia striiformis f. sp. tritici PST-130]|nr:hypothetical protein H4Q26_003131 [Puccinia striiformis f. sp. tritici PST-130]